MDEIKETKNIAINKLNTLNIEHIIDYKTYEFYLTKVKKVGDHLIRYLETEKILSENLNKLKEVLFHSSQQNNKALHEQANLAKRAQELQEDITKTTEELRKVTEK